jgi:hypothetical protein
VRRIDDHPLQWVTAAPLWDDAAGAPGTLVDDARRTRMQRPAILRFASDSFMDDLAGLLAVDPSRLAAYEAQPVSHRPMPPSRAGERARLDVLKLFQPAHGDFYLVASTLVCRRGGLPDHAVHPERREQVAFVLRRVGAQGAEQAWVADPAAPKGRRWDAVPAGYETALLDGEDLHPLFGMAYEQEPGRTRRVFAGLVPTATVEAARNAAAAIPPAAATAAGASAAAPAAGPPLDSLGRPYDPRLVVLDQRVIAPLAALRTPVVPPEGDAEHRRKALDEVHEYKVDAARFLLVELGQWLADHQPAAWTELRGGGAASGALARRLRETDAQPGTRWAQAILDAWAQQDAIFGEAGTPTLRLDLETGSPDPQTLRSWLTEGLSATAPAPDPEAAAAQAATGEPRTELGGGSGFVPKVDPGDRFRLRCVYRRPDCEPLHTELVSAPSEDFKIASFYDVDAPARPLTIGLPIDTSIRDLRKFKRNVSVALSDELRRQVTRVSDMKALISGSVGSAEPPTVGLLCSFSIPIITICALILLMIMVNLLNVVFRWLPYFQVCFPIGPKARP